MSYDPVSNLLTSTNPDGATTTYTYDGRGNKTAVADALGQTTAYQYDDMNRMVQVVDSAGSVTQLTYDGQDRPLQITANVLSSSPQVTTLVYDDETLSRSVTNAIGQTTVFNFDRAGNVIEVISPDGNSIQYQFNLAGEMTGVIDPLGRNETTTYDDAGRKLAEIDALGSTTTYIYDGVGNVTSITNARGDTTQYLYDQGDRMRQVLDPLGGVTNLTYDARGNLSQVTNPAGQTTILTYDARDNLTGITNPVGATTQVQYSSAGLQTAMISPRGDTITFDLDPLGRVQSETKTGFDASTATTSFTYDATGNRASMTDANGSLWTYQYDDFGRLSAASDPLGNTTTYQYDALGNLLQKQLPNSCTVDYTYDPMNRVTRTDYSDGGYIAQTYDALGNVTKVEAVGPPAVGAVGETNFQYDGRNRVVQASGVITGGVTFASQYAYDAVGNPTGKAHTLTGVGTPITINQTWDANNRLTSIHRTDGAQVTTIDRTYDAAGRLLTSRSRRGATTAAYTNYQYDAAGRVTRVQNCTSATCATVLSDFTYTYDADGNRTSETAVQDGQTIQTTFQYDGQGRLVHSTAQQIAPPGPSLFDKAYGYDTIGNRLSELDPVANTQRLTSYDDAHRIVGVQEFNGVIPVRTLAYTYDANGNLVNRQSDLVVPPAQPVNEHFEYSCDGQLTSFADLLNAVSEAYLYDGLGNKVGKRGTTGAQAYVYDGPNRLAEYDVSGPPALQSHYLYGQEIDERAGAHRTRNTECQLLPEGRVGLHPATGQPGQRRHQQLSVRSLRQAAGGGRRCSQRRALHRPAAGSGQRAVRLPHPGLRSRPTGASCSLIRSTRG